MKPPPSNRVMAKLEALACPSCDITGTLRVISALGAVELGSHLDPDLPTALAVSWRPVLTCVACDLYVVGRYTLDGNSAVFGHASAPDAPAPPDP